MKLLKISLFGLLAIAMSVAKAQDKFTISGYVKDAENGEALIGSTIFIDEIGGGTTTNVYGFYAITLPKGNYTLTYRYLGFQSVRKQVELTADKRLDIELSFADSELQEVEILANAADQNVTEVAMSTTILDVQSIKKMPAFAGEVDVIKSIQMLPGVTSVGEGAPGFNVRGGSVGQNLVLLDEAPVYQSSHLFGFFSVFNPDAVKDIKLYKGGIPAKYGGRLSSVLDIRMKEGNTKNHEVNGGIGTVFSRLSVEGPIKKDKASFIIAGRRSYADVFAKAFTDMLSDGGLYFYDLTSKVNLNINDKNRLFVSGYWGRDVFDMGETAGFDWGNRTATLRWNHLINHRLFSNFSFYYSLYDYGFSFGKELDRFEWKSNIQTYNFKPEFAWSLNSSNELTFGAEGVLYQFMPGEADVTNNGDPTHIKLIDKKALEASGYVDNSQRISNKLSLQYGFRMSFFTAFGGTRYHYGDTIAGFQRPLVGVEDLKNWEASATFQNLEPRFSARYQLGSQTSLKLSYNRMAQYLHQISNTTASTPTDVWQPSNENIKPQTGNQIAFGYFRNLEKNTYEASLETYYKWSNHQTDYIDGAELFVNEQLDGQLLDGKGRSYGLELYLKKNVGRLTGWVSYTLSKTERKVDGINYGDDFRQRTGQWYPTRYDQRHNLKVAAFYELNEKLSFSGNFSFMTGTPTTLPTDRLSVNGYVIPYISGSKRNNYRIPDYHRLDLSLTIKELGKNRRRNPIDDQLVLSIYNVYARQNPFSVYFSQGTERQGSSEVQTAATQMSMLGTLIPAVSYNFKF